jgi:Galactosyltransferase
LRVLEVFANLHDLAAIIIVTSYVGHKNLRAAHRQAIPQHKLKSFGLLRIFLLAEIPVHERYITQREVEQEQVKHGDLLQGNFVEAYRNLTYKHLMGLRWAVEGHCTNAKYIIKIDDDTVYDVFQVQNYIVDLMYDSNKYMLAGYLFENKKPIRDPKNKWYVSVKEFGPSMYPPYLSGWLYITNINTARDLVRLSYVTPFFWIDDTYITGVLAAKLNIHHVRLNKIFSANTEFIECCISDLKKYSYKCDYVVGPNSGDAKLIAEFTKFLEICYLDECYERPKGKSVAQTCIGQPKRVVADHGVGEARAILL